MPNIKLKRPLFVFPHNHAEGDVIEVAQVRGADLVKEGYAEFTNEKVTDPDRGAAAKHAGVIWPEPPAEYVTAKPSDNLAPHVGDNPGLVELAKIDAPRVEETSPEPRKAAKGDFSPSEPTEPVAGEVVVKPAKDKKGS